MASLPAQSSDEPGDPIDFLLLAVKAFAARAALADVAKRLPETATVVLLCNGALAVAEDLAGSTNARLLVATTTHGAWTRSSFPCRDVHHAGKGSTWVGTLSGRQAIADSTEACAQFASVGLGATIENELQTDRRLWYKLAANATLNPLTAMWDAPNGDVIRRAEGREVATQVCEEIAQVAAHFAQPPAPTRDDLYNFVFSCAEQNSENFSSMCMDVRRGHRTEIEQLNGWVESKARTLGIEHSANTKLADGIRDIERRHGHRLARL